MLFMPSSHRKCIAGGAGRHQQQQQQQQQPAATAALARRLLSLRIEGRCACPAAGSAGVRCSSKASADGPTLLPSIPLLDYGLARLRHLSLHACELLDVRCVAARGGCMTCTRAIWPRLVCTRQQPTLGWPEGWGAHYFCSLPLGAVAAAVTVDAL